MATDIADPSAAELDLLVVGSGVAGLSAAVRAAESRRLRVGVLTKGELDEATTRWAQGGIAAVLGGDPDSTELHFADTLTAGAGLCDPDAVRVLVDEGPTRLKELIELGAMFDRDPRGALALTREGGHSHARVVHAGGAATGLEVERALVAAVRQRVAALYEGWFASDLVIEDGRCTGVTACPPIDPRRGHQYRRARHRGEMPLAVRARHVLLATGGAGELFAVTTNPAEATGDGMAMAMRAGVPVADTEFVQFHPTALHHPVRPRPLLSEALRGHGALLRDTDGERFVDELRLRDQVSRAITERMLEQRVSHVWLDATAVERFGDRFPTIAATLFEAGLDPARDWLPVAPAAHYICGGIVADLDGASALPGLWAAGEVACGGVHGANRLASNSLLDGMVFGARVVEAIERGKDGPDPSGAMRMLGTPPRQDRRRSSGVSAGPVAEERRPTAASADAPAAACVLDATHTDPSRVAPPQPGHPAWPEKRSRAIVDSPPPLAVLREQLQTVMTTKAGVVRSGQSLEEALVALTDIEAAAQHFGAGDTSDHREYRELLNLAIVGRAVCVAAAARRETRGAHARSDYPDTATALSRHFAIGPRSATGNT